jgi:hypothetical protein
MITNSRKFTTALTLSTTVTLLGVVAGSAQAGIVFTYGGPGVQIPDAAITGLSIETFNSAPSLGIFNSFISSAIGGTYNTGRILGPDQFGGSNFSGTTLPGTSINNGTNYLSVNDVGVTTLKLNTDAAYFGAWWSAGDAFNKLEFFKGATLIGSFTNANLLSALPSSYFGNPVTTINVGANLPEPYAYINFFASDSASKFDTVVFSNLGGGTNFESDNHAISVDLQPPIGIPVAVPEPASILGLVAIGMLGASSALKRKV